MTFLTQIQQNFKNIMVIRDFLLLHSISNVKIFKIPMLFVGKLRCHELKVGAYFINQNVQS